MLYVVMLNVVMLRVVAHTDIDTIYRYLLFGIHAIIKQEVGVRTLKIFGEDRSSVSSFGRDSFPFFF
jgi:hypothetical protein